MRLRNELYSGIKAAVVGGGVPVRKKRYHSTLVQSMVTSRPKSIMNKKEAVLLSTNEYLDFSLLSDASPSAFRDNHFS
jgi:hypothetical protein